MTKLNACAPRNFKLEWKGDLLSPIRYKTETTKESGHLLAQIWAKSVSKITNRPHVNHKKYIRINILHKEDTVTITIHPTGTIMLQGSASYDWADNYMESVNKEVDIEIEENKSKLNHSNESNISSRSVPIYGVCAMCDQVNNEDMLECEHCYSWTHNTCAGFSEQEARKLRYYCKYCSLKYGLKSFFPDELPDTSTPMKPLTEDEKNCTKENTYSRNLLFMQKNLSKMADDEVESNEESERVNELKNLAKTLSETMENALKASNVTNLSNNEDDDKSQSEENLVHEISLSTSSESLNSENDHECLHKAHDESFEQRPPEQRNQEFALLNSSADSISDIDPNEYNMENILKTVRKLQQEKFKNEAEIQTLNQKLHLADQIIKITESDGKKPEKHRLYNKTKKEIMIEYMKLEDIIIIINEKLNKSDEKIKEMKIEWEDLKQNQVELLEKEKLCQLEVENETKTSVEQLKSENEWLLKKAEEAKAELVNLQKSNQIQKYNIAYFQEQLEDLQVTNTQLNAMLIMEKETTELVKAEDLLLKETNNKLVNALKKLQNDKSPENLPVTVQNNCETVVPQQTIDPTNMILSNNQNTMNQPVLYNPNIPPPELPNPTASTNVPSQDKRTETQNYYRPVCKDYVNGKCFSRTCIYYHPKKVSKSRVQTHMPARHEKIPSILDLDIPLNQNYSYSLNQAYQTTSISNQSNQPSNTSAQRFPAQTFPNRNPPRSYKSTQNIGRNYSQHVRNQTSNVLHSSSNEQFSNQINSNQLNQVRKQNLQRNYDQYNYNRGQSSLEAQYGQRNITQAPNYSQRNPLCRYYLRGNCRVGNFCQFSHQITEMH